MVGVGRGTMGPLVGRERCRQPGPRADHGHAAFRAPGARLRARRSRGGRRRGTGEGDETAVKAEVCWKAGGGRCYGERRPVGIGGGRRCLGWRASEVRTEEAGRGREQVAPRGTRRRRRQLALARFLAARSAGLGRHRPPRALPSLCLLLAGEARFRGAFSRPTLHAAVSASCCFLQPAPRPCRPAPPGSWGPSLSGSLPGWARLGCSLWARERVPRGSRLRPAIPSPGCRWVHGGRVAQRSPTSSRAGSGGRRRSLLVLTS